MDGDIALGFTLAVGAACCYETGYALQAFEARRAPSDRALKPSLLTHLGRRPLWVGATALSVLGWPLQIGALAHAPLTLVQPTLSLGLLLLLALAVRVLDERVGRREVSAVTLIIAAVGVFAWAAPRETGNVGRGVGLVLSLGILIAVTVAPFAIALARRGFPMMLLVASAGAADALAAFAAKIVAQDVSDGALLAALAWVSLVASVVILGVISESTALQRFAATRVAPTVLVMQIVIPVVLAPLVGGEGWGDTPLGGAVLVGALVTVGAGAGLLASSPAVARLAVGEGEDR